MNIIDMYENDPLAPTCGSCGVPLNDHLGLTGTCAKLQEAKKRIDELEAIMIEEPDDSPMGMRLSWQIHQSFLMNDENNALKKRMAELESRLEWQPIETAPKDTWIFVGRKVGHEWLACKSGYFYEPTTIDQICDYWYWACDYDHDGITEDEGPSHWMPLPEPPKEVE